MAKIVQLQHLQGRLRALLEDRPDLARAFEHALVDEDEQALATAFERLRSAPNDLRLAVEGVILEWLFGGEGPTASDPFAEYPVVSRRIH